VKRKRLGWLAFRKPDAYAELRLPKPGGGERVIHAPCAALKFVQRRILRRILDPVVLHRCCHGFRAGRSIVSNARPHEGKHTVVGLDLRDFFPSVTFPRVFGVFRALGFPDAEAGLLARLTTWQGRLPQGAPTSPAIANLACRTLDRRLAGLAESRGAAYTRYADDLAFSGPDGLASLLPVARRILAEEGFSVAEEKTRIMRRGSRQTVCGVVVNRKAALPRETRRRLRAVFHRAAQAPEKRKGPVAPDATVRGYRALLRMFEAAP
jgi:retron-type reverse transcriptase